jgi:hypothetical protein
MDNDAQQILDEYLQRVGELFADVESWIYPTQIKIAKAEISISEEACGTYTAHKLILLPSRSKNAYFESYKISAKPREIKACGILQSGRFMSEKGVNTQENKPIAEIIPVAAWVVGANGRIDIRGIYDNIILLHLNQGGPAITTTIRDGKRVTSQTNPIYRGITEAGWYAIDRRTSKGHKFNKQTLFDVLLEVSDYELQPAA